MYNVLLTDNVPIKHWTTNVPFEEQAKQQQEDLVEIIHTLKQVLCVKG